MKIRLSNQLGCAEKEKMLPEHCHRGYGLCLVTLDGGTHYHPCYLQSSSQQELPAAVVPSGTPWCWRLRGLELIVMVPICLLVPELHYHEDAAGIPLVTAGFWDRKSGPALQSQSLFAL